MGEEIQECEHTVVATNVRQPHFSPDRHHDFLDNTRGGTRQLTTHRHTTSTTFPVDVMREELMRRADKISDGASPGTNFSRPPGSFSRAAEKNIISCRSPLLTIARLNQIPATIQPRQDHCSSLSEYNGIRSTHPDDILTPSIGSREHTIPSIELKQGIHDLNSRKTVNRLNFYPFSNFIEATKLSPQPPTS